MLHTFARWAIAWLAGVLLYIAVAFSVSYDGLMSIISGPIIGAFYSIVVLWVTATVGLLLRLPSVGSFWHGRMAGTWIAALLILAGLILIGHAVAFSHLESQFEIDTEMQEYRPVLPLSSVVGYLMIIFSISNWPDRRLLPRPAT